MILDEVTYAVKYGWVEVDEVVAAARATGLSTTNVVVTGRYAPDELIDVADTVTEMRKVKHAMDEGIGAARASSTDVDGVPAARSPARRRRHALGRAARRRWPPG